MASKTITITSKNQITIPVEFVRKLGLDKSRQLSIRRRGNELIIKPSDSARDVLAAIIERTTPYIKIPVTDEAIKQSLRQTAAERGNQ